MRHNTNRAAMVTDAAGNGGRYGEPNFFFQHSHNLLINTDKPSLGDRTGTNATAFLASQRQWYYTRPHDWHHPTMDAMLYRYRRGDHPLRTDPVGPLRFRGHVVLNRDNQQVSLSLS